MLYSWYFNKRPISQIPKYTWYSRQISHNTPFCMAHYKAWDWCIMGFAEQVYWLNLFMPTYLIIFLAWQLMLTSVWWTPLSNHLKQADSHVPFVCSQHGVSTDLQAHKYFNSLRHSDLYRATKFWPSLLQAMAWYHFHAKSLFKPMITYCQLDP